MGRCLREQGLYSWTNNQKWIGTWGALYCLILGLWNQYDCCTRKTKLSSLNPIWPNLHMMWSTQEGFVAWTHTHKRDSEVTLYIIIYNNIYIYAAPPPKRKKKSRPYLLLLRCLLNATNTHQWVWATKQPTAAEQDCTAHLVLTQNTTYIVHLNTRWMQSISFLPL